jgi:hypothetical protein
MQACVASFFPHVWLRLMGLQRDFDLLMNAIVNNSATCTITACFNNNSFDFLITYATHVRGKLDLYENVLLCPRVSSRNIYERDSRCASQMLSFEMLDRDLRDNHCIQTFNCSILVVPFDEELHLLRIVSEDLTECGFSASNGQHASYYSHIHH